jgi:hypothetical protein
MRDIEKEIADAEEQLKKLREELALSGEPMYALAVRVHELMCQHQNHADCGWETERAQMTSFPFTAAQSTNVHARNMRLAQRLAQELGGIEVAMRAVKVLLAGIL